MNSPLRQTVLSEAALVVTGQTQDQAVRPVPPPIGVDNGQPRPMAMTRENLCNRWRSRRDEWARLGVQVNGAALAPRCSQSSSCYGPPRMRLNWICKKLQL
jgi:hypothetical protein